MVIDDLKKEKKKNVTDKKTKKIFLSLSLSTYI